MSKRERKKRLKAVRLVKSYGIHWKWCTPSGRPLPCWLDEIFKERAIASRESRSWWYDE